MPCQVNALTYCICKNSGLVRDRLKPSAATTDRVRADLLLVRTIVMLESVSGLRRRRRRRRRHNGCRWSLHRRRRCYRHGSCRCHHCRRYRTMLQNKKCWDKEK